MGKETEIVVARLVQRSRPDLLSDLRVLTLVIAKLGGVEAIIELFHAILLDTQLIVF